VETIFTTREISTAIWLIFLIVFVFACPKTRGSGLGVIKAACTPKLFVPFVLMLIYALLLVYALSTLKFWKWQYLKEISIWVLFVGIPLCYKATMESGEENYFSNIILSNLKLAVLVEFIISSLTFNLIVEIILIPIITLLVLIDLVIGTNEESVSASKFISFLVTFVGMLFIGLTIAKGINSYKALGTIDSLVTFLIPIFFSFLYVPAAYIFSVYAKYDSLFCRISFREPKDKRVKRKHRMGIFKVCGLSIKKIIKFKQSYAMRMYVSMTSKEFDDLIEQFRGD
jgi:hypothetical protein